jgi:hypothetical protein
MSRETELRAIWGVNYDKHMAQVTKNYDSLNADVKAAFDRGGVNEVIAVALLTDVSYTDKKHPQHNDANRRVTAFFNQVAGNDEMVL